MNLLMVSTKTHPEDVHPNIVLPFAESNGTSAVLDAVKLNLAIQGFRPTMVRMESDYDYDQLIRRLWREGQPFILIEHDIIPWPGALLQLHVCDAPWCGFQYFIFGELRSYLGCTKFDPAALGECPLPEDLIEWQHLDKTMQKALIKRGHKEHIHGPPVSHLHIVHSRMRANTQVNPYFWDSEPVVPEDIMTLVKASIHG